MSGINESKDHAPREDGLNGGACGRGKGGEAQNKSADNALSTLAAGRGEERAWGAYQKKSRSARSDLPILIYSKEENIQTNLKEFTEQLAFVAGVEFGDAFTLVNSYGLVNCCNPQGIAYHQEITLITFQSLLDPSDPKRGL